MSNTFSAKTIFHSVILILSPLQGLLPCLLSTTSSVKLFHFYPLALTRHFFLVCTHTHTIFTTHHVLLLTKNSDNMHAYLQAYSIKINAMHFPDRSHFPYKRMKTSSHIDYQICTCFQTGTIKNLPQNQNMQQFLSMRVCSKTDCKLSPYEPYLLNLKGEERSDRPCISTLFRVCRDSGGTVVIQ